MLSLVLDEVAIAYQYAPDKFVLEWHLYTKANCPKGQAKRSQTQIQTTASPYPVEERSIKSDPSVQAP